MRHVRLSIVGSALLVTGCTDQVLEPTSEPALRSAEQRAPVVPAGARAGSPIPNEYIVTVQPGVDPEQVARSYGIAPRFVYRTAMNGFAGRMSTGTAQRLKRDRGVIAMEPDLVVTATQTTPLGGDPSAAAVQTGATWGIDRTDQRNLPLNSTYNFTSTGAGVRVYVLDTGIRTSHQEFWTSTTITNPRAFKGSAGFDAIGDGQNGNDCNGHGTHVSGTIAGLTYGIAKAARVYAVRVLNCTGNGTTSGVIAGINWVVENHIRPAVANMSLGGGASPAMDNAVTRAVAYGVTFVVAAGNESINACNRSPARAVAAITVGATQSNDARSSFSNFGSCLDIFAPGTAITSAWFTSNTATNTINGTSMATPHVAGMAALFLQNNAGALPGLVTDAILSTATPGLVTNAGAGSPNLLLNRHNGLLIGTGSFQNQPHGTFYTHAVSGYHRGYLRGSGSNFDLRLFKWNGSAWAVVASATTTGSIHAINYRGTPGSYYWEVRSASGGGTYDFFLRKP